MQVLNQGLTRKASSSPKKQIQRSQLAAYSASKIKRKLHNMEQAIFSLFPRFIMRSAILLLSAYSIQHYYITIYSVFIIFICVRVCEWRFSMSSFNIRLSMICDYKLMTVLRKITSVSICYRKAPNTRIQLQ